MPIYRHQITYPCITGLPEDRFVNTLHSNSANDAAAIVFAQNIVISFGSVLTGQSQGLTEYLGPAVSRAAGAGHVLVYDLSDPTPRVPVHDEPFTVLTNTGSAVPEVREAAIVLSFQADPAGGMPQARRRGRIYFGPLASAATMVDSATGDVEPSTDFKDDAAIALEALMTAGAGQWVVYSPTNSAGYEITNGWIDDAMDTQRRRGQAPASRTVWP